MRSSPDTVTTIPLTPILFLLCYLPVSLNAACISLSTSKLCRSFHSAQFEQALYQYPFLNDLQNAEEFDQTLKQYVEQEFSQNKFMEQFICTEYNITASYYARFTTTILCASIIQLSSATCAMDPGDTPTVCASTCAEYAQSEAYILQSDQCQLDLTPTVLEAVRADYDLCTTPGSAYESPSCVDGLENEPDRCGYASNTDQLCSYCTSGTTNTTNSCCETIGATACEGIPIQPLAPPIIIKSRLPIPSRGLRSLGSGLIVLIVLAGIFGISGLTSILIILYWRRRKKRSYDDATGDCRNNDTSPNRGNQYMSLTSPKYLTEQTISNYRDEPRHSAGGTITIPCHMTTDPSLTSGDEQSIKSRGPSRTGFYEAGPVVNRSEMSLSGSSQVTDHRPISFVDQYSGQRITVGSIVRCIHDYEPILPDELDIHRGDVIKVTQVFDDRWCKGFVLTVSVSEDGEGSEKRKSEEDGIVIIPKAFPIVCVCSISHDPGFVVSGRSTPGLKSIGGGGGGRESPVLTSVPEESNGGGGSRSGSGSSSMIPKKKPSMSRFREHVGIVDE